MFDSLRLVFRSALACLLIPTTIGLAQGTGQDTAAQHLSGTQLLEALPADPAMAMVAGIDRFALRQIERARTARAGFWQTDESRADNLNFLKSRLGILAEAPDTAQDTAQAAAATDRPEPVWRSGGVLFQRSSWPSKRYVKIDAIRWPVARHPAPQLHDLASLWGEGLLLEPSQRTGRLAVVLPDADEWPEAYCGLLPAPDRNPAGPQLVERLLRNGYTVVIPQLVSRATLRHGAAELSQREYLQRAAFELGRSLLGYEVLGVQRLLDEFTASDSSRQETVQETLQNTMVIGFGEGGLLALLSGAVDERIATTVCCGYFGPRETMWSGPLDRNLYGVLERFGDAELGAMLAPRKLIISATPRYEVAVATAGAAPALWQSPRGGSVAGEFARMQDFVTTTQQLDSSFATLLEQEDDAPFDVELLLAQLELPGRVDRDSEPPLLAPSSDAKRVQTQAAARLARYVDNIDAHTQAVLEESEYARVQFINLGLPRDNRADGKNTIDTSSPAAYQQTTERFRQVFTDEVIGRFDEPLLEPAPRTRPHLSGPGWNGYEVVLDVFEDVFAYGVLLVPDDLRANERRPVVVCQHGLEGRPQDTITGDHYAYHDFAAQLASRGFIVFAPQNPYIGQDAFRTLQRKLNPLGKSLFSVIGPQHQQILNWLSSLPQVDPERIAFYGLSYGGKSAMRLPAMLPQYCLSICSADFNDWVWKNASSRSPYSYIGTGEYEIFEYDLGHTFNYAEMAALIAPRPFMVERGHYDGVAPDDRVAKEFARVRFLYAARLGLTERCEIEWFNGPHTINGQGTFDFLHRHLRWPVR